MFFAIQQGSVSVCVARRALGDVDEVAQRAYAVADGIFARTVYRTRYFDHIGVLVQNITDFHPVAVLQNESGIFRRVQRESLFFVGALAQKRYIGTVSVAAESAGKTEEVFERFALAHFVAHGPFHFARRLSQNAVRVNLYNVAVLQRNVGGIVSFHQIFVNIDMRHGLSGTKNPDITQAPYLGRAARHIQGMEGRSERRERIGAGADGFAHDMYADGADIAYRYTEESMWFVRVEVGVDGGKFVPQARPGLIDL